MLYKNKIKVQNILKSALALMFMLTLSLSTALSPLAKAEEAGYTWKTLTTVPVSNDLKYIYISPDGSKLFIQEEDSSHNSSLWMSADDGATWRKIFSKQVIIEHAVFSVDGSKIAVELFGSGSIYVSVDGGQSWTERQTNVKINHIMSPDGSFLVGCFTSGSAYTTYISTDDGHNWTQKSTNSVWCPTYVTNNGTLIAKDANKIAKSTDYGQTWTEISIFSDNVSATSFSNNGNNIFDGDRISLDGGNHWTPSNAPIPAGKDVARTGISDDGKKLFVTTKSTTGANPRATTLLTSVDGGRTWHSEDGANDYDMMAMSNDVSKLFNVYADNNGRFVYRLGTLPAAQPVTPGSGAGGAATPSASTSAALNQKPGKASGRLAETGTSTWTVGGLAVVAVAAGALVLRKRL